ncbi:hypothetical protein GE300_09020 [Rhodobacteraceae bacterium 2CG4]|uniref:Uncharacterized protein n=1 Tax=Halovulum marinum TaxID=2662447 RepID=A0A6L5YZS3_9RHOB|nr:hypothetical protein [Halovulum marinum]MSU89757.1 hypothetical protein [Halovulum marinum]
MSDSDGRPEDDDLLTTIRALVSEEAERAAPRRPASAPNAFAPEAEPAAAADPDTGRAPTPAGSAPLVLDNPVRPGPRGEATAPMYDEEALRAVVTELVRDELDQLMGDALEMRIRKAVRREIARLAARRAERAGG